jgi:hypothetical protein
LAYFNVKGGEYKIMSVSYGDEIIIPSRDLFINIEENIAHLKEAYQYYSGVIILHNRIMTYIHNPFICKNTNKSQLSQTIHRLFSVKKIKSTD